MKNAKCSLCSTEKEVKGKANLPRNWRQFHASCYCDACWKEKYRIVAVTLPVAEPIGCDWKELDGTLTHLFDISRKAANIAVTRLASLEVHFPPFLEKVKAKKKGEEEAEEERLALPNMTGAVPVPADLLQDKDPKDHKLAPSTIAYRAIRKIFPDIDSQTVASLSNEVTAKYIRERFDCWTRGIRSLSNYRRMPYSIPKVNVSIRWLSEEQAKPLFTANLGGVKMTMRLSRSDGYKAHKKRIQSWIDDPALLAQCAIYRVENNGRPHGSEKAPGGGNEYRSKLMVKIVGWVPKSQPAERVNTITVSFPEDSFLKAVVGLKGKEWRYHNDQLGRLLIAHKKRTQRLSDDQKFERRRKTCDRRPINDYREVLCDKMKRRMDAFIHESTRHLANFARRQRASKVIINGDPKCFSFPSFVWKEKLKYKLSDFGIDFEEAKVETVPNKVKKPNSRTKGASA